MPLRRRMMGEKQNYSLLIFRYFFLPLFHFEKQDGERMGNLSCFPVFALIYGFYGYAR